MSSAKWVNLALEPNKVNLNDRLCGNLTVTNWLNVQIPHTNVAGTCAILITGDLLVVVVGGLSCVISENPFSLMDRSPI